MMLSNGTSKRLNWIAEIEQLKSQKNVANSFVDLAYWWNFYADSCQSSENNKRDHCDDLEYSAFAYIFSWSGFLLKIGTSQHFSEFWVAKFWNCECSITTVKSKRIWISMLSYSLLKILIWWNKPIFRYEICGTPWIHPKYNELLDVK